MFGEAMQADVLGQCTASADDSCDPMRNTPKGYWLQFAISHAYSVYIRYSTVLANTAVLSMHV